MINEHIYRRFNHTVAACFVIYFLFPQYILGINRGYYLFLFWILILAIEYLRLNKELNILQGIWDKEYPTSTNYITKHLLLKLNHYFEEQFIKQKCPITKD